MLTLASLVVTFIAAGAGIYFYQRARRSMILLHDGAKFYESLRQELNRANSRISVLESEKVALTSDAETARKAHRDASSRAANAESEFLHMQTTLERKLANAELQRDHILNRYETLQAAEDQNIEARNELDATIKSLEAERVTLRAQRDDARQAASLNLKSENSDLRRRVNDLEREIAQAKSRQEIDPKAHDALRRRANHNEQLYHSMKSLRDMADERNKNWENALRDLATWILSSSPLARPNDPVLSQSIGPIVGEALQRIGGSLLGLDEAEELAAEKHAMSSADL